MPANYMEMLPPSSSPSPNPFSPPPPNSNRPVSSYSQTGSISSVANSVKKQGPAVAPRRGAKKLTEVEALYDFEPASEQDRKSQFGFVAGERFVLVKGEEGEGWWDVERMGITKMVPANYVQKVE